MPTPHTASPSSARTASRAASKARNELIAQLKDDHQRVKKAYAKYRRLDAEEDADMRQVLVQLVLDELCVHARLEEEQLYPAARQHLKDDSQVEEAEVEHEMLHILINQLREMDASDDEQRALQNARFTVLCEYTLHHVKEEEREMFPQLMKARLDWLSLLHTMDARRAELQDAYALDGGDRSEGGSDGLDASRARDEPPLQSEARASAEDEEDETAGSAGEAPTARAPSARQRRGGATR